MNQENTKQIPYGIGNFIQLRENNFFYVDKTPFLPLLEKSGHHLFLIRPRRIGKTLLITMLESYYDVLLEGEVSEPFPRNSDL